jgi:L-serine dehydratase
MRFRDVFSIIGPAMIGPSSSHTAGALRIGRVGYQLLGGVPERARITLYGSFAETYAGHGTDLALIGGLLGRSENDPGIARAKQLAEAQGMDTEFIKAKAAADHPNTVSLQLQRLGESLELTGASIGGGNIVIREVDGFRCSFTADTPTLLVYHSDRPGVIAEVTRLLSCSSVNIARMSLDRQGREAGALAILETDQRPAPSLLYEISGVAHVSKVREVDMNR